MSFWCMQHVFAMHKQRLYIILNNPCYLFTFLNEEKVLSAQNVMWKKTAARRGDPWLTELPALGDEDWNPPRLILSFLVSLSKRNKGRGKTERPQVTFRIISSLPQVIKREKGGRKRRGGNAPGKGKDLKKRSDVFVSSPVCLVALGSGFPLRSHLVAPCFVTAKCVKTPPTKSWRQK